MTAKATTERPGDDGILRIGDTAEEPKYDVLFRISGKEYQGLTNPDGRLLFRYLDMQRKRGLNAALSWLFEEMLSADAYEALMTDRAVSKADFGSVRDLLTNLLFSADADPKSPGTGRRRTGG